MSSEKNFRQKLSSAFKKVALAAALAVGLSGDNAPAADGPVAVEPLTKNEIALVKSIFGDEVNTSIVRKNAYPYPFSHYHPHSTTETPASVNDKKNIIFYERNGLPDCSDPRATIYGTFIHEMTHIWQRQKIPGVELLFMSCHDYDYTLDANSRFSDFCIEQQGAIIEDYAMRFLHDNHTSLYIKNIPENDALLKKVVEDRFPEARKTRLAAEKQTQLKTAAASLKSPKP
ncbi:MAG: hypothetical protein K8R48_06825 [Alphaproteobacteria bacterium]|nr:hypothetical protein [Alphaproteobacteria bacterium]